MGISFDIKLASGFLILQKERKDLLKSSVLQLGMDSIHYEDLFRFVLQSFVQGKQMEWFDLRKLVTMIGSRDKGRSLAQVLCVYFQEFEKYLKIILKDRLELLYVPVNVKLKRSLIHILLLPSLEIILFKIKIKQYLKTKINARNFLFVLY